MVALTRLVYCRSAKRQCCEAAILGCARHRRGSSRQARRPGSGSGSRPARTAGDAGAARICVNRRQRLRSGSTDPGNDVARLVDRGRGRRDERRTPRRRRAPTTTAATAQIQARIADPERTARTDPASGDQRSRERRPPRCARPDTTQGRPAVSPSRAADQGGSHPISMTTAGSAELRLRSLRHRRRPVAPADHPYGRTGRRGLGDPLHHLVHVEAELGALPVRCALADRARQVGQSVAATGVGIATEIRDVRERVGPGPGDAHRVGELVGIGHVQARRRAVHLDPGQPAGDGVEADDQGADHPAVVPQRGRHVGVDLHRQDLPRAGPGVGHPPLGPQPRAHRRHLGDRDRAG